MGRMSERQLGLDADNNDLGSWLTVELFQSLLGGEISADGQEVCCAGPWHSAEDRSITVRPSGDNADGFIVHSFGRTPWPECRDYVNFLIERYLEKTLAESYANGIDGESALCLRPLSAAPRPKRAEDERIGTARRDWRNAWPSLDPIAEAYFNSRKLIVPREMLGRIVKYQPNGRWYGDNGSETDRNGRRFDPSPMLLFAARDANSDKGRAVQLLRLPHVGKGPSRKIRGIVENAAIKLTPHEKVIAAGEVTIGEGFETCLAAMMLGHINVWSVINANNIASFPVMEGVGRLTILGEHDAANLEARKRCALRWIDAGRDVIFAMPDCGKDFNDDLVEMILKNEDANG